MGFQMYIVAQATRATNAYMASQKQAADSSSSTASTTTTTNTSSIPGAVALSNGPARLMGDAERLQDAQQPPKPSTSDLLAVNEDISDALSIVESVVEKEQPLSEVCIF